MEVGNDDFLRSKYAGAQLMKLLLKVVFSLSSSLVGNMKMMSPFKAKVETISEEMVKHLKSLIFLALFKFSKAHGTQ